MPDLKIPLQRRVHPWLMECFGPEIAADATERNHRFLEESLELVQACGCTASEAHQLVDYVFGRPVGEKSQEAGGVVITLAALCLAQGLDMHAAGEVELARIWTMVDKIRAKQAAKPRHSPLPAPASDAARAFEIADSQMMVVLTSYGQPLTGQRYARPDGGSDEFTEAVEWLLPRGYIERDAAASGEVFKVLRLPEAA